MSTLSRLGFAFAVAVFLSADADAAEKAQITTLYDAFGTPSQLQKDWGFSAYIEYDGKRILFDTGNNADVFAHNVKAKGIDLKKLDFVVVSHRHGDHTSGLNYVLQVNPKVPIYAPKENFGVFGAALPGTFIKPNNELPAAMRYFDGKVPEKLTFGSPWQHANFTWVSENIDAAPGFHLVLLKGSWGVDLDVMEISLAIDTPNGAVVVVGCSHPTIEAVVRAAQQITGKPIHLVLGGTHLLPAKPEEIERIAGVLRDDIKVEYLAPVHCTGEAAFAILQKAFGDRYVYAGLGSTVQLGPKIVATSDGGNRIASVMTAEDLRTFRQLMLASEDNPVFEYVGRVADIR